MKGWLKLALALLVGAAALLVWLLLSTPGPAGLPPMPTPNGYTNLLQAGRLIVGEPPPLASAGPRELRAYLLTNRPALHLANLALTQPTQVPLEYSSAYLNDHVVSAAYLKRVALALRLDGRLAELEQRTNDAWLAYLDLVRLGQAAARGGMLIDRMIGLACEGLGLAPLNNLVQGANAKQCRLAIEVVQAADQNAESMETVMERERQFTFRAFGWRVRIFALFNPNSLQQAEESCTRKSIDRTRERRLLLLNAAVRAYGLERGTPPTSPEALVPLYLKALPRDPVTGLPLDFGR